MRDKGIKLRNQRKTGRLLAMLCTGAMFASVVVVATSSTAGASVKLGSNPAIGISSSSIDVGWMGDMTGPTASSQLPNEQCTAAYFKYIDGKGGVVGHQLTLTPEDDQFETTLGEQNYQTLINADHVFAIESMGGGQITQPLAPTVTKDKVTVIDSPQSTTPQVASPGFFMAQSTYGGEASTGVAYMDLTVPPKKLKVADVSLAVADGLEYNKYVEARVKQVGGTFLGDVQQEPTDVNAVAQVTELQQMKATKGLNYISFMGSSETLALLTTQMKAVGLKVPIVGIHTAVNVNNKGVTGTGSFLPGTSTTGGKLMASVLKGTGADKYIDDADCVQGFLNGMITQQAIVRMATELKGATPTRTSLLKAMKGTFNGEGLTCPINWAKTNVNVCSAPMLWNGSKYVIAGNGTLASWSAKIPTEYSELKLG
jgi:ABC-type branched-subunit amino acid transport system substrate-binding protein